MADNISKTIYHSGPNSDVGPLLRVELFREPGKSLGISIVGGRGMGSRLSNGEVMRGIFIKHILEDSPAGQNGTLKTGDRIVEVKCKVCFEKNQETLERV